MNGDQIVLQTILMFFVLGCLDELIELLLKYYRNYKEKTYCTEPFVFNMTGFRYDTRAAEFFYREVKRNDKEA